MTQKSFGLRALRTIAPPVRSLRFAQPARRRERRRLWLESLETRQLMTALAQPSHADVVGEGAAEVAAARPGDLFVEQADLLAASAASFLEQYRDADKVSGQAGRASPSVQPADSVSELRQEYSSLMGGGANQDEASPSDDFDLVAMKQAAAQAAALEDALAAAGLSDAQRDQLFGSGVSVDQLGYDSLGDTLDGADINAFLPAVDGDIEAGDWDGLKEYGESRTGNNAEDNAGQKAPDQEQGAADKNAGKEVIKSSVTLTEGGGFISHTEYSDGTSSIAIVDKDGNVIGSFNYDADGTANGFYDDGNFSFYLDDGEVTEPVPLVAPKKGSDQPATGGGLGGPTLSGEDEVKIDGTRSIEHPRPSLSESLTTPHEPGGDADVDVPASPRRSSAAFRAS
jgi:hypothetical protein